MTYFCSNDFYNAKSSFITINASLCWSNNVVGVYLVQVSLLLFGQQGLGHFFRHSPLLAIGWRIVQILRQCRRWSRLLFRPKTSHTFHHNPNPSRETVPLRSSSSSILPLLKWAICCMAGTAITAWRCTTWRASICARWRGTGMSFTAFSSTKTRYRVAKTTFEIDLRV